VSAIAQKLFAFFISSSTAEGVVALRKLTELGVSLDDVAESIGAGKFRTKYGNIEFSLAQVEHEQRRVGAEQEWQKSQCRAEEARLAEVERLKHERQEQYQREYAEFEARTKAYNPLARATVDWIEGFFVGLWGEP